MRPSPSYKNSPRELDLIQSNVDQYNSHTPWTLNATAQKSEIKRLQGLHSLKLVGNKLESSKDGEEEPSRIARSEIPLSANRTTVIGFKQAPLSFVSKISVKESPTKREDYTIRVGNQRIPEDPRKRLEIIKKQDLVRRQKNTLPNIIFFSTK